MDGGNLGAEAPAGPVIQRHNGPVVPVVVVGQKGGLLVELRFRVDRYSASVKFTGCSNLCPHSGQTQLFIIGSMAFTCWYMFCKNARSGE